MPKIIIIGSGVAGLASALRFSVRGYEVDVFESNNYVGGKIAEVKGSGYRFDAGPSLFTMPELIDDLIRLSDNNPQNYFQYSRLKESCRYFFDDKTIINGYSDIDRFVFEASKKTGVDPKKLKSFFKKNKFIYNSTKSIFIEKSLHKLSTYLSFKTFLSFLKIPFLNIFTTMNKVNENSLKNKKLTQLFNRFATYNGSNPYKAPGILNIISHLEFNQGAFFPKRGMRSIVDVLYKICLERNVKFHLNSKVDKINLKNNKVTGVEVNGKSYNSDLVISNVDIHFVYKNLLDVKKKPIRILKQERSSSALIFYWGISKLFKSLDLHNILFSSDYKNEFNQIFNEKTVPDDPTVYINITSKYKYDDAPKGHENWFVMINVPHNQDQDWKSLISIARKNIIHKINNHFEVDLEKLIVFEEYLDPIRIENKTGSYLGSLYGNSSNSKSSAFFRHANFSSKIKDLYFCGGSVHPGGGIPLALNSAKIIDEIVS